MTVNSPHRTHAANRQPLILFAAGLAAHHARETCRGVMAAAARQEWFVLIDEQLAQDGDVSRIHPAAAGIIALSRSAMAAERLAAGGLPLVELSHHAGRPAPALIIDEALVGERLVSHLAERGYRQILVLPLVGPPPHRRADACLAAALRLGIPAVAASVPGLHPTVDVDGVFAGIAALIDPLPRPLGITCFNDTQAHAVISACVMAGFAVPQEIGVVGVDDDPLWQQGGNLGLSSLPLPHAQLGELAVARLAYLLAQRSPPSSTRLILPELSHRASTMRDQLPDRFVQDVRAWLGNDTSHAQAPEAFAEQMGMSRRTLERRFRQQRGHSLGEERTRLRLSKVRHCLRAGATVDEAARSIGLSRRALEQMFMTRLGCTPAGWVKATSARQPLSNHSK